MDLVSPKRLTINEPMDLRAFGAECECTYGTRPTRLTAQLQGPLVHSCTITQSWHKTASKAQQSQSNMIRGIGRTWRNQPPITDQATK